MKGFVVAGTHSGCGKTTITLGLMAALKKKGLIVQPFKAGPDFIDSGLHGMITGRVSRNLDLWMCGGEYVKACHDRYSADADISVVEGVMGLYDGNFSTAALARTIGLPVVLVVDAYGMAETAGAIVQGMMEYEKWKMENTKSDGYLASPILHLPSFFGVIFNRIASERHFKRLKDSVSGMPVLGYLPRDLNFEIPHRHLGLTTAEESPIAEENIEKMAAAVIEHIDVEKIIEEEKWKMPDENPTVSSLSLPQASSIFHLPSSVKIAVARDRAFCFYYEDNMDMLRDAGAEIVYFSPLTDTELPTDIDGIYIGGGYPELHAEQLSKNISMCRALKEWAESGGPIYAECGGLMYLTSGIQMNDGEIYNMVGIFPFGTAMKKRLARLGYREVTLNSRCILGEAGAILRGHEFHYSEIPDPSSVNTVNCYTVRNADGLELASEGYPSNNVLGSYIHMHFGCSSGIAKSIVDFIKKRGK